MAKKRAGPKAHKPQLDPLVRKIARVEELSAQLNNKKKKSDPKATAELLALSAELAETFRTVRRNANELDAAARRAANAPETAGDIQRTLMPPAVPAGRPKARAAFAAPGARPLGALGLREDAQPKNDDPPEGMGLAKFLNEISESVIAAQHSLDLASLRNLVAPPTSLIPPNYYVIPSVKAELKVGVKVDQAKKMQLIFFSKSQEKQDFSENTVSFELVATPPPPGARGPFTKPIPGFLAVDAERDRVIALADTFLRAAAGNAFATHFAPHQKNAAVFRSPGTEASGSATFVVAWPATDTSDAPPTRAALIGIAADGTQSVLALPPVNPFSRWSPTEVQSYLSRYFELSLLAQRWIVDWLASISIPAPKPA